MSRPIDQLCELLPQLGNRLLHDYRGRRGEFGLTLNLASQEEVMLSLRNENLWTHSRHFAFFQTRRFFYK